MIIGGVVNDGSEIQTTPVAVIHPEAAKGDGCRLPDPSVVKGDDLETRAGSMGGESSVEPLRHSGDACHNDAGCHRLLGLTAP